LWISLYIQSTTRIYNCDSCQCHYVEQFSLSCKNRTCIKIILKRKLIKLMLHSLVWIKSMSWFLITTYLLFRDDVPKLFSKNLITERSALVLLCAFIQNQKQCFYVHLIHWNKCIVS
jgi:hypothetical protein